MLGSIVNSKVLLILSGMISHISPGNSHFSRVMLPYCDAQCQQTPLCEDQSKHSCKAPKLERWHYNKMLSEYKVSFTDIDEETLSKDARLRSFSRAESYDEGLLRYLTIAEAIYEVSRKYSFRAIDRATYKKCSGKRGWWDEECKQLRKIRPWKWSTNELHYSLVTIAKYESGFRLDIHSGIGKPGLARGDCGYFIKGKKAYKHKVGAELICQSVGLAQRKLIPTVNNTQRKTSNGWTAEDLMGVDLESTKRTFTVATKYLSMNRGWCARKVSGGTNNWANDMFTGYGTGSRCKVYKTDKDGNLIRDEDGNRVLSSKFLNRSHTLYSLLNRKKPLQIKAQKRLEELIFIEKPYYTPSWITVRVNASESYEYGQTVLATEVEKK